MKQRIACVFSILSAILVASSAVAHSDLEKPMFVAQDGVDAGRCHDPTSPCRTISYALDNVGKGGQIRVADGRYAVTDVVDVFHLISGVVDIRGGYVNDGRFEEPSGSATTLTGVPFEYREQLRERGFHVVADRKGINESTFSKTELLVVQKSRLHFCQLRSATPLSQPLW